MDAKYFEEIKAREQAATPGPWYKELITGDPDDPDPYSYGEIKGAETDEEICTCKYPDSSDSAFIAHARTDIPALISALRETQDENSKLIAEVERLRSCKCVDKCKLVCMLDEYDKIITERNTLKKALELACRNACEESEKPMSDWDIIGCPPNLIATCKRGNQGKCHECWERYFIQQAQEQEGKNETNS